MPPKNAARYTKPDSRAANPDASRLLNSIVSSGIVQLGDKARKWDKHPSYITDLSLYLLKKLVSDLCISSIRSMEIKQNVC